MTATSEEATLTVLEDEPPTANLLTPSGGEFWLLSEPGQTPNAERIAWEASDNVRVCQAELALLYSDDGTNYVEAPPGGGLPTTIGQGGAACPHPGLEVNTFDYTVPTEPPAGNMSSQYKIRLRVTDHAGNTTEVKSARPFTIARPNPNAIKTLLLTNVPRMVEKMDLTVDEVIELNGKLLDLAAHPDVLGYIVDLSSVPGTPLADLYAAWDADPGDPAKANAVLFDDFGIHERLRDLVRAFPGVEYVIVVGDDRIVPFARIKDRTTKQPEREYPVGGDLTADGTTVGRALAANSYLSDDLLAVLRPLSTAEVDERTHLPDLGVGRLVETPREIVQAVTVFLNQNGILDLTSTDPVDGHKVLVTAYDFLIDSGKNVRRRWKDYLGVPHDDEALAPVDGVLVDRTWGEAGSDALAARRLKLLGHFGGNGGERYGVVNLNGHATHYEEGVPGANRFDIQGVGAFDLYGLDLVGCIVYSTGCHGGLPVAGSDASDADHSLDLPQTMLARGVQAYVANTGYGWGLVGGTGYTERLVEILTTRLTQGGTVTVGRTLADAKAEYYLSTFRREDDDPSRLKPYAEKAVQQWTLFGFPMYAVRTGADPDTATSSPFTGKAAAPGERPTVERLGTGTTVTRRLTEPNALSPSNLSRLELHFDFFAPGDYRKVTAVGDVLPGDPTDPANPPPPCPPPAEEGDPEGCYYTWAGLASDDADLPVEPFTVLDTRLAGKSQHGVVWLGGTYWEETGWTPVFAELASNTDEDLSDHGSTPRVIVKQPTGPVVQKGDTDGDCRSVDLELASLVLTAGEVVRDSASGLYDVHRLYEDSDVEVFYYNNTLNGDGNCDRLGPELHPGPFGGDYHLTAGPTIQWAVPAEDEGGVWRVVVVYNDNTVAADGTGRWVPLELSDDDGDGTWKGGETFLGAERVTYVIQAVDRRGNVTWLDYVTTDLPASGVTLGLPETVDAEVSEGEAGLVVDLTDDPDPVLAGDPLRYTVTVTNAGPDPALKPSFTLTLPPGAVYELGGGDGWSCTAVLGIVDCTRETLPPGSSSVAVFTAAPAAGGGVTSSVVVEADNTPDPASDTEDTTVVDDTMTDLAVFKDDGGLPATPGEEMFYSITVSNKGPNAADGATVTDLFPGSLHSIGWSCVATVGSRCTTEGSGDIVDVVLLLPGGTLLYTASAWVDEGAGGEILNVATVEPPTSMTDFYAPNDASATRTAVGLIFEDGFESGDLSRWSSVVGDTAASADETLGLADAPRRRTSPPGASTRSSSRARAGSQGSGVTRKCW